MPKPKQWVMPKWMQPYRAMFVNTGGNSVEELMNNTTATPFNNHVLAGLCIAIKSQAGMLERMHADGLLPPPDVAAVAVTLSRQRRALLDIANSVDLVLTARVFPKKLRPGMQAIAEACRRGVGA